MGLQTSWTDCGRWQGCSSGDSTPRSRHVAVRGGSFATVGEGSGVGRQRSEGGGDLGGPGYGWGAFDCAGAGLDATIVQSSGGGTLSLAP